MIKDYPEYFPKDGIKLLQTINQKGLNIYSHLYSCRDLLGRSILDIALEQKSQKLIDYLIQNIQDPAKDIKDS